jgi:flagellar protein FliS
MSLELYKDTALVTAKPEDQISLLFDGWIVALHEAEAAIQRGDVPEAHNALVRGQNLAGYLWTQVNDQSPYAGQTRDVLSFLQREQVRANVEKSAQRVVGVREVVEALKGAWEASRQRAGR